MYFDDPDGHWIEAQRDRRPHFVAGVLALTRGPSSNVDHGSDASNNFRSASTFDATHHQTQRQSNNNPLCGRLSTSAVLQR